MNLKEIIKRIDKSEENTRYIDLDVVANALDITFGYTSLENDDLNLKCYYLSPYRDYDYICGEFLYFLNNEFVAISKKLSDGANEEFQWLSEKAYDAVRNYLLEIDEFPYEIELCDLEDEFYDGYPVLHPGDVLDWDRARYDEKPFTFIRTVEAVDPPYDDIIEIKTNDGEIKTVSTTDIKLLYHLRNEGE